MAVTKGRCIATHTADCEHDQCSFSCPQSEQIERESLQSSPPATDPDPQLDTHSVHSDCSSITDLRERVEKISVIPTSTTASPPPSSPSQPPPVSTPPQSTRTLEPGDFGLRATAFVPTPDAPSRNDWVRLNVGGKIFATTRLVGLHRQNTWHRQTKAWPLSRIHVTAINSPPRRGFCPSSFQVQFPWGTQGSS